MNKVIQIADLKDDNRLITPLETLRDAIRRIEDGDVEPDKLIVLALQTEVDGEDGFYKIRSFTSNMLTSETVALLEVAKAELTSVLIGRDE